MSKSLVQALNELSEAATDCAIRLRYGHAGIAKVWEKKMHPGLFELRMDMRRDERREREMVLLRVIGGILSLLFYLFVVIGTFVVIGLLIYSPLIALIVLVCVVAAIANAYHRHHREKRERFNQEFDEWRQG